MLRERLCATYFQHLFLRFVAYKIAAKLMLSTSVRTMNANCTSPYTSTLCQLCPSFLAHNKIARKYSLVDKSLCVMVEPWRYVAFLVGKGMFATYCGGSFSLR